MMISTLNLIFSNYNHFGTNLKNFVLHYLKIFLIQIGINSIDISEKIRFFLIINKF